MTQTKIITKSAPFYYEMLSAIKFNEKYYLDMIHDATGKMYDNNSVMSTHTLFFTLTELGRKDDKYIRINVELKSSYKVYDGAISYRNTTDNIDIAMMKIKNCKLIFNSKDVECLTDDEYKLSNDLLDLLIQCDIRTPSLSKYFTNDIKLYMLSRTER
jgi:hypothetical protein